MATVRNFYVETYSDRFFYNPPYVVTYVPNLPTPPLLR